MNINNVVLGGNIVRDLEVRYTPGGLAVLDFTIANNRKYKAGEEMKEEVSFIGCTAYSKTAETIAEHFYKGAPILIEGRIKTDQWEDKEGVKKSKTKVVIDRFHFCGSKKKEVQAESTGPVSFDE